jgi:hypothetical protein
MKRETDGALISIDRLTARQHHVIDVLRFASAGERERILAFEKRRTELLGWMEEAACESDRNLLGQLTAALVRLEARTQEAWR